MRPSVFYRFETSRQVLSTLTSRWEAFQFFVVVVFFLFASRAVDERAVTEEHDVRDGSLSRSVYFM